MTARVSFAQLILEKLNESPNFLEMILFSDEALFHLEGGVNKHTSTHWSKVNPHWIVKKFLNSPKIMVWAAVGAPGIIGPVFIDGNIDGAAYLELLANDFFPAFSNLRNSSDLIFMQDGAPPHWNQIVRDWLNQNLPHRWIGRGGPHDTNIAWPPRSPDLTPMDFAVWGLIKNKVYVRNYENLTDLKASIAAAFQELTAEIISATLQNMKKWLKLDTSKVKKKQRKKHFIIKS